MSFRSASITDGETKPASSAQVRVEVTAKQEPITAKPGSKEWYMEAKKKLMREMIKMKLLIDGNIERLEKAMEKSDIQEQDYIRTYDTMMLLKRIVLPNQQIMIDLIKTGEIPFTQHDGQIIQGYVMMYNMLWLRRDGKGEEAVSENNLFDSQQLSAIYDYAQATWKKHGDNKMPIVMGFKEGHIDLYKKALTKWEREYLKPAQQMLKKYLK